MSNKTPKEIFISENCSFNEYNISTKKCSSIMLLTTDKRYLSEQHFNSLIEEKDKEIWILKEDNRKHLELIKLYQEQIEQCKK